MCVPTLAYLLASFSQSGVWSRLLAEVDTDGAVAELVLQSAPCLRLRPTDRLMLPKRTIVTHT